MASNFFSTLGSFLGTSPAGSVVAGPSKEELADRWISENLSYAGTYNATLATLSNDITNWSNLCGDYVHISNKLYNRANGRSICQTKIEEIFAAQLAELKNQEYYDAERAKNPVQNNKLLMVVALVVIVMIIIVLILKM